MQDVQERAGATSNSQQLPETATIGVMPRTRTPKFPPPAAHEIMTIDDLARYLQVSKSSLYKLAHEGRVPGQQDGKHWQFSRIAIEKRLGGNSAPHSRSSRGTA